MDDVIFCRKCGQKNDQNNHQCTQCSYLLHEPVRPAIIIQDDSTMGGLVPYKNASALLAYYLGIFALLPLLGIPFGIASLVFGIKGLKFAGKNPEAKGAIHAWVGIVLGAFCLVGHGAVFVALATMS